MMRWVATNRRLERTIQRNMAGFLQYVFEVKFIGDAERRELHHNPGRLTGIGDFPRDALDSYRSGKAGHEDGGVARGLSDTTCDGDVSQRKLGPLGGIDIKADDAPAAINKVASDRATHDTKPDNSNGLIHEISLLEFDFLSACCA